MTDEHEQAKTLAADLCVALRNLIDAAEREAEACHTQAG